MAVSNGMPGDENSFNNAFVSKTVDSTVNAEIELADGDVASGTSVTNAQKEHNSIASFAGKTLNTAKDNKPSWSSNNYGSPTDSLFDRAQALDTEAGAARADITTAQADILLKEDAANKGVANGYAPLDGSAKIDEAYLPDSITGQLDYKGTWDASTNTPSISDAGGSKGEFYNVTVAGSQDLGSGSISFTVGDTVIHNGTVFEKIDGSTMVSVNGQTGAVVLNLNDINDVDTTGVSTGDILRKSAGDWVDFNPDQIVDDATSGSNVTLASVTDYAVVRLTNASLVSVDMIPAATNAQRFILVNATGVQISINNLLGGTAANQIITGTGANLDLLDQATLFMVYDTTETKWRVVGGSGAGGGVDIGASTDNAIVRWDGTTGDAVQDSGVTIDDSDNMEIPGTILPISGITNGANTVSPDDLVKLRNLSANNDDGYVVRYDEEDDLFVTAKGQKAGLLFGENSDFEFTDGQWTRYDDGAAAVPVDGAGGSPTITLPSRTTSASEVLDGQGSLKLAKSAANSQGQGWSLSNINVPMAYRGKSHNVKFFYSATANFNFADISNDSDVTVWAYDETNSVLLPLNKYRIYGDGTFSSELLIPSTCDTLRLILHVSTTNATAWDFIIDNVLIQPVENQTLANMSDWASYTPIFTGFGTVTVSDIRYKINGDDLLISGTFVSGTTTATEARISLPSGYVSKSTLPILSDSGSWMRSASSSSHGGRTLIEPSVGYITFTGLVYGSATFVALAKANGTGTITIGETMSVTARIPIQGLTSGYSHPAQIGLNSQVVMRASKSGGSISANTTIPSWTTVDVDSAGGFDSSTGIYTVKSPGSYHVEVTMSFTAADTSVAKIYLDAAQVIYGPIDSSGSIKYASVILPNLKYGQQITVANQTARTLTGDSNTKVSIFKIGSQSQPYAPRVCYIKDVQTSGTEAGTFTSGSYATRILNTVSGDQSFLSLGSNQITLQPGTYHIEAIAPALSVQQHKAKLRNITDSVDVIIGQNAYSASAGVYAVTYSEVIGTFNISSAKVFEIQHICGTTRATNGLGAAGSFGDSEVYTQVKITKVL